MKDSGHEGMNIVHVNSADHWAGGEVHVFLLCKALIEKGHHVTLVCRPGSAIDGKFRGENMPVYNLPLKGSADTTSVLGLAKFCRNQQVDILHAHLGRDYWIAIMAQLFCRHLKTVFTRHLVLKVKHDYFHRWLFKKVNRVIAVSKAVEGILIAGGVSCEKIATVYNGIDYQLYASAKKKVLRTRLNMEEGTPIIGMVGTVSPHKGLDFFLQSIPIIVKQNPRASFVVVGDDLRGGRYIQELKEMAGKLEVGKSLHFLGHCDNVPDIMADFDILVLASRNESFGLVIAEAMAAGKPVVAADVGGVKEIVVAEETGLLFPAGDSQALAQKVAILLNDQVRAENMGRRGAERAKHLFSSESMANHTIQVYNELLTR
ncbi:MAG TPA: GT4 family glycosyltransferase PelF [Bacillota bacterium]|nr:GT4 family glycosyltransferase PelF [Bacillota bacterium]